MHLLQGNNPTYNNFGLDRVMEKKVGFGKYQLRALLILALIDMNDGAELVLMSLLVPIIKEEFGLSQTSQASFSSIFYFGMIIGAFLTGKIADKFGRRRLIIIFSLIQAILVSLFGRVTTVTQLLFLRFLLGIVYGFTLPLSSTMYAEISTVQSRGKGIVVLNSFVGIGKMYGVLLAYIILDNIKTGDWRSLMMISSLSCFLVFIGSLLFILESPRFLIASSRFEEAKDVLQKMIKINHQKEMDLNINDISNSNLKNALNTNQQQQYQQANVGEQAESDSHYQQQKIYEEDYINNRYQISELDMEEFEVWQQERFKDHKQEKASFKALFNKENWGISWKLFVTWFCYHSCSKGQILILPFVLGKAKEEEGFGDMMATLLGEIPAIFIGLYLIDKEKYGRKNTLTIFFAISALANIGCFFNIFFVFFSILARFCFRVSSSMIYAYTTEVYSTYFRTIGIGWASGMGRVGTCLMPYIIFPLFYTYTFLPYLLFTVYMVLCAFCGYKLPYDTSGKVLDYSKEIENKDLGSMTQILHQQRVSGNDYEGQQKIKFQQKQQEHKQGLQKQSEYQEIELQQQKQQKQEQQQDQTAIEQIKEVVDLQEENKQDQLFESEDNQKELLKKGKAKKGNNKKNFLKQRTESKKIDDFDLEKEKEKDNKKDDVKEEKEQDQSQKLELIDLE